MEHCELRLKEPIPYRRFSEEGRLTPALPISIYRLDIPRPLVFPAVLDTGSEYPLVLSPEVRDELLKDVEPGWQSTIWAGENKPCDVFEIKVKMAGKWKETLAYAPLTEDYDNIVGLPLLKDLNCCLRFPESQLFLGEA